MSVNRQSLSLMAETNSWFTCGRLVPPMINATSCRFFDFADILIIQRTGNKNSFELSHK